MNRIIVFMQVWNEANWLPYSYESIYDFADEIILSEGCHTTWNVNSSTKSTDGTIGIIKDLHDKDKDNKLNSMLLDSSDTHMSKLIVEVITKNTMLMNTKIEYGDWIFIVDADEAYKSEDLAKLKEFLKTTDADDLEMSEYQFVYNFNLYMNASHHRLFRYIPGSRFAGVNHLIYATGNDYRNNTAKIPEDICKMYHYPYVKPPKELWTKINSFNRDSHLYPDRIKWFKDVYMKFNMKEQEKYYKIVKDITGAKTFAWEGGSKLYEFTGTHPSVMNNHPYKNKDWLKEIKKIKIEDL